MPELSSNKIINHLFHVDNDKGESGIGYDMIIGRDLIVQIGLTATFKRQVLQWNGATVHMKEPIGLLGKSNINNREMSKVVMQTTESDSTRGATEQTIKIPDNTHTKANL